MQKTITVVGSDEVRDALRSLGDDAHHAVRIATQLIGEHAQRVMREQIRRRFTLRQGQEQFDKAIIFVKPSVSKKTARAILKVGSESGGTKATWTKRAGQILARHEEAGTRESSAVYRIGSDVNSGKTFVGGFFIPAKGLRTSSLVPPRSLYPSSIGAKMRQGDGRGEGPYFAKSNRETKWSRKNRQLNLGESFYVVENLGIFRRKKYIGPKMKNERGEAIWWFAKRIRTPARLRLWETTEEVFDRFAVSYALEAIDIVIERSSPIGLTSPNQSGK